jgi:hypothetical protein
MFPKKMLRVVDLSSKLIATTQKVAAIRLV